MDFYFCNNLVRPDFEGFLMIWKEGEEEWRVLGRGYPYLSIDLKELFYYFICYDKFSDKMFFKLKMECF